MLEGLYSAASGMEAQQQQFNAISNDMANLDTPGYQSTIVGFHDLLYTTSGPQNATNQATGAGAAAQIVGRSQALGEIAQTGRSLDSIDWRNAPTCRRRLSWLPKPCTCSCSLKEDIRGGA